MKRESSRVGVKLPERALNGVELSGCFCYVLVFGGVVSGICCLKGGGITLEGKWIC